MNQSAMKKLFAAFAILPFTLAIAACGSGAGKSAEAPPLAGAAIKGDFTLLDKAGQPVSWTDFDGRYRIVYFGYTYCPDVCPLDVQNMVKGLALFAKSKPDLAKQVQPIFITIDPGRDTPQAIGEFTGAFSSSLVGLTGTPDQIRHAAKGFAVYYAKGETTPGGGYLMDHSRAAYLMGRKGEPIALLPVDKDPQSVAAELEKWVS
jgi:protein SCO1/2